MAVYTWGTASPSRVIKRGGDRVDRLMRKLDKIKAQFQSLHDDIEKQIETSKNLVKEAEAYLKRKLPDNPGVKKLVKEEVFKKVSPQSRIADQVNLKKIRGVTSNFPEEREKPTPKNNLSLKNKFQALNELPWEEQAFIHGPKLNLEFDRITELRAAVLAIEPETDPSEVFFGGYRPVNEIVDLAVAVERNKYLKNEIDFKLKVLDEPLHSDGKVGALESYIQVLQNESCELDALIENWGLPQYPQHGKPSLGYVVGNAPHLLGRLYPNVDILHKSSQMRIEKDSFVWSERAAHFYEEMLKQVSEELSKAITAESDFAASNEACLLSVGMTEDELKMAFELV